MPIIAIAESLAFTLGCPIEVSLSLRVIRGRGFQIDFCKGGISVIIQEDILSAIRTVLGEPEESRFPVFGVSEHVFLRTSPLVSPTPESIIRKRLSNGWVRIESAYGEDSSHGKSSRLSAA